MTLSQMFILREESFLYWCHKNKTTPPPNTTFLDAFEQATKSDSLPNVKPTERFPKTLACDMMASSGTLAIDTESSIISL